MLLLIVMLTPLIFAVGVLTHAGRRARDIALAGALLPAAFGAALVLMFDWARPGDLQFAGSVAWLPDLGLMLSVGVDSISLLLVALTLLLGPICVACSTTAIRENRRSYYAWLLVLQSAMTGVFASRDIILFYVCFEFTLVPMYVLIHQFGSTNRVKAATKFFLYTFTGSMIALAGLAYVAWFHAAVLGRGWTFDIQALQDAAGRMPASSQAWVLGALLAGFAVKVPMFPLHTWLPLAHTEAPTAGSVILAGVLLKLGTYGIYRLAIPFAPEAFLGFAPGLAVLCIVGILYGGLICWVQTDVKKLVAYSSVAHLGFCVLGLVSMNTAGLSGAVLYMINHGLSTGALFLCIGMIYERYHTRSMKELGGLAKRMPIWASFMVFFVMASVGLPGLNGFVSEFLCLLGAFQASSAWGGLPGATPGALGMGYTAVAGAGMIVAAIYLLYMTGKVVFGPLVEPHGHDGHGHGGDGHGVHESGGPLPRDLCAREIWTLAPLAVLCLALGVYPAPVLRAIEEPVNKLASAAQREAGAGGHADAQGREGRP